LRTNERLSHVLLCTGSDNVKILANLDIVQGQVGAVPLGSMVIISLANGGIGMKKMPMLCPIDPFDLRVSQVNQQPRKGIPHRFSSSSLPIVGSIYNDDISYKAQHDGQTSIDDYGAHKPQRPDARQVLVGNLFNPIRFIQKYLIGDQTWNNPGPV
jgi:hypothetical protein